jgi:hypothetical protein
MIGIDGDMISRDKSQINSLNKESHHAAPALEPHRGALEI